MMRPSAHAESVLLLLAVALAVGNAASDRTQPASAPAAGVPVHEAPPLTRESPVAPGAREAAPQLALRTRAEPPAAVSDLFGGRSWTPPPAPPPAAVAPTPPPAPPAPVAPPLPFAYLGRVDAPPDAPLVYLARGERLLEVSAGHVIDDTWRVEAVAEDEVVLVFLPLAQRQSLRTAAERP